MLDVQISGISASGDFSQSNNCPATLPAGAQCAITVIFKPSAAGARNGTLSIAANVTSSPRTVSLQGSGADFQLAPPPSGSTSQTVKAGQTATFTLEISGSTDFHDSVSFACANVPAGYTCAANPQTITVNSTSQNVTVSVSTPASSALWTIPIWEPPLGLWSAVAMTATFGLLLMLTRRRKMSLIAAVGLMAVTLSSACGGGGGGGGGGNNPPPPVTPQTHSITLTATSQAGAVKSTTLTVTVN